MIVHQEHNSLENYNYNAFIYDNTGYSPHFHKNYELVFELIDKTDFVVNGETISIKKGQALLVAPNIVHSFSVTPGNALWVGVFSKDYVSEFFSKNTDLCYTLFDISQDNEVFLRNNLFYSGVPTRYMLISCLNLICDESIKNEIVSKRSKDKTLMFEILDYISQNFSNELTMKKVAVALGYEYHYFSRIFHEMFSVNFSEYINIYKTDYACNLLKNTDLSITEISTKSGFSSIRNFNRIFRQYIGITPKEYKG